MGSSFYVSCSRRISLRTNTWNNTFFVDYRRLEQFLSWSYLEFPREDWIERCHSTWTLLATGLLIINATVVTVPSLIVGSSVNGSLLSTGIRITTFIIVAFIDEFIAKNAAGLWKEGDEIQTKRPAEQFFGTKMSPVK
jgi:hypothetical protein